MSTRKGNNKKRGQKHQNTTTFKNNLHDTSKTTKTINNLLVQGVCERCRSIIEWKKSIRNTNHLLHQKNGNCTYNFIHDVRKLQGGSENPNF